MSEEVDDSELDTIVESFVACCRRGENPEPSAWVERFPRFADELRGILATIHQIETGGPKRTPDPADVASDLAPMPDRIGDFQIVRQIGRGGMGVVFEAIEDPIGRRVALKVLPALSLGTPNQRARFNREAEVASRLEHPGICAVYRAGIHDGIPFLAMRFVEGETLAHVLHRARAGGRKPTTGDELSAIFIMIERVARALSHAHDAGVVHRDVKPSNIMIDPRVGPVVLDFGLARAASGDVTLTDTGGLCGTPHYLAPEVLRAGRSGADPSLDVYGLGAVLFECLTLRCPFDAPTPHALYRSILEDETPDPRALNPAIGRDAMAVTSTALEKEPSRRYRSAAAFADDLRALAEHRPVAVQPPSRLGRIARWMRREPVKAALVAALAVAGLALAGVGGFLLANASEIRRAKDIGARERVEAALVAGFMDLGREGGGSAVGFGRALAEDPSCAEAVAGLALDDLYDKRPADAIAELERHPELQAARPVLGLIRSTALRRLGRADEATRVAEAVPAPTSVFDWFVRGLQEMDAGMNGDRDAFVHARDSLRRAVLMSPTARPFQLGVLAQAAMYCGDGVVAADASAALVDLWPQEAASWVWRAIALQQTDVVEAESACRRALQMDPALDRPRELLVELLGRREAWDEAAKVVRERPGAQPSPSIEASAAFFEGAALWAKGDFDGARERFVTATTRMPGDARNWVWLGDSYNRLRRFRDAESAHRTAIACDRTLARAHEGLGLARWRLGDAGGALDPLREAARLDPKRANTFNVLGAVLNELGRRADALAAVREAFRLDPSNAVTWSNLHALLDREGRFDEVLEAAGQRAAALPLDPSVADDLGSAHLAVNRFDDALAAFDHALQLAPDLASVRIHRADALRQLGRFREAVATLRDGRDVAASRPAAPPGIPWDERIRVCEADLARSDLVRRAAVHADDVEDSPVSRVELAWTALVTGEPHLARRWCAEVVATDRESASPAALFGALASISLASGGAESRSTGGAAPADARERRFEAFRYFRARLDADRSPLGAAVSREVRVRWLQHLHDPRLAPVRDPAALSTLPDDERRAWLLLWDDARRFLGTG